MSFDDQSRAFAVGWVNLRSAGVSVGECASPDLQWRNRCFSLPSVVAIPVDC